MSVWFLGESPMKVLVPWISGSLLMICFIFIYFLIGVHEILPVEEFWNKATWSVSPVLSYYSIMLTHGAMARLIVI